MIAEGSEEPFWSPDPETMAAELEEYRRLSRDDRDALRRLYINEFYPPEPIHMTWDQYVDLRNNRRFYPGIRFEVRNHGRTGPQPYIDGRPVVFVAAGGGDGSDDDDPDADRAAKALCFGTSARGRIPKPVSIH